MIRMAPLLLLLLSPTLLLLSAAADVQVNCFPELRQDSDPGRAACEARKCEYVSNRVGNAPFCLWRRYGYTVLSSQTPDANTWRGQLRRDADYRGPFPASRDEDQLLMVVKGISDDALRISITDHNNARYRVPQAALNITEPGVSESGAKYSWRTNSSGSLVEVSRKSGERMLSLQTAGMVYSDQFLQAPIRLDCERVYGLGEHNHERLLHDRNYRRWTIWTRDASPTGPWNLYSAHPYFICGNKDAYVGLLLKSSNAIEVELTPDGAVFRTVGGVLDFYAFFGDTPEAVTRAYSSAVGHPLMPPYWSLGFQLCRWGYENVTEVQNVIRRNRAIGIPYDVQYGDIDYMQNTMDFTIDHEKYAGLDKVVDDLHKHGQRYFVILDPAISSDRDLHRRVLPSRRYEPYEDGLVKGVFVKNADGSVHEGEVWPGRTVFPDFSLDVTQAWWERWVRDFYYNQNIKVDGLWIDMNEPASFTYEPHKSINCSYNKWNYPPYKPTSYLGDRFYEKTMCMEVKEGWGKHYDTHSLYGHAMAMQSYQTLRNMFPAKRPIVFSRSTFPGTARYAQHWLGDNHSRWSNLHWSIVTMLEFGLFGFPYTGADICGFVFDAERQMCIRWMQLGSFYPFSRNHNIKETHGVKTRDQDPGSWDPEAQKIMRDAFLFRYKYLPYLYTLFHYAHTRGDTVVRSLNHEFPHDANTANIDRQFLWGSAMLVTPVLEADANKVTGYFPSDGWYDAYDGTELPQAGTVTLDAPLDKINVHIRKGHILPWQQPSVTTVQSRKNPLGLLVALRRTFSNPVQYSASGSLFWDDGEAFETQKKGQYLLSHFEVASDARSDMHMLEIRRVVNGYKDPNNLKFQNITFYGFIADVSKYEVLVNSKLHKKVTFSNRKSTLTLEDVWLDIDASHKVEMRPKGASVMAASSLTALVATLFVLFTSRID